MAEEKKKTVTYASPAAIPSGIKPSSEAQSYRVPVDERHQIFGTTGEIDTKIGATLLRNKDIDADAVFVAKGDWRLVVKDGDEDSVHACMKVLNSYPTRKHTFTRAATPKWETLYFLIFGMTFGVFELYDAFFSDPPKKSISVALWSCFLAIFVLLPLAQEIGRRISKPLECIRCSTWIDREQSHCPGCKREVLRDVS